jgi:hypothetical protein
MLQIACFVDLVQTLMTYKNPGFAQFFQYPWFTLSLTVELPMPSTMPPTSRQPFLPSQPSPLGNNPRSRSTSARGRFPARAFQVGRVRTSSRRSPLPPSPAFNSGLGPMSGPPFFFAPAALTRNFFIAVFPSDVYDVRPPFGRATTATQARDGWRITPTSRWYVYFGCSFCGEYHRKYGFASLEPRTGDGEPVEPLTPWSFLVQPTKFPECPSCLGDQCKRNATARGLRLGAC